MKTSATLTASTNSYHASNDVAWQVQPGWQSVLLSDKGLRLDQWLAEGNASVVKAGSHRTVYRVDLPDRSFFLKHYRCPTLRAASRHLVRPSASLREWRKARAVAERNIPTFQPVALGEQRRAGLVHDSYLVTEAIANSCSLDDFVDHVLPQLPSNQRATTRRQLIENLAAFCAKAHDQGIDHDDFHTGNILVQTNPQATTPQLQLFLIDLPGVRLSGPLSWRRSRNSLAMLHAGWLDRIRPAEAWRFWLHYLAARRHLPKPDVRTSGRSIAARSRRAQQRVIRSRDRRIWNSNRDFRHQTHAGHTIHLRADLPPDAGFKLTANPAELIEQHLDQPHKLSHSTVVVQASLPTSQGPIAIAVKRCRRFGFWKRCTSFFRPGRALRAWYTGHALRARGIRTVEPLLAFERVHPVRGRDSYLITRWIEGTENLHVYGWSLAQEPIHVRRTVGNKIAKQLGRHIGHMHAWSASHRDLKACNFALLQHNQQLDVILIDLDGVRFPRYLTWGNRVRDLARLAASIELQLWVTPAIRARFLKAYINASGVNPKRRRKLVSDVNRRVRKRLKRRQATGRPLT